MAVFVVNTVELCPWSATDETPVVDKYVASHLSRQAFYVSLVVLTSAVSSLSRLAPILDGECFVRHDLRISISNELLVLVSYWYEVALRFFFFLPL